MKLAALLTVVSVLGSYAVAGPVPRGGSDNGNGNGKGHGHDDDDRDHGHGNGHGHGDHGCKGGCGSSVAANALWQYSNIAALTDGVAANGTLLKNILAHGDTGLGTFNKLQGEMIILDGVIYRSTADQVISTPDIDTTQTPFAAVTKFEPEETATASFANYSDFTAQLPSWFNSSVTNHFISYRLDGHFTLRVRAPGGQNFPLEPIANVTARQTEWDFDNIEGTMVGFRTPAYAANINAAGDHLHFISADRTKGGHVLSFRSVGDVSVKAAKVDTFTVEVPRGGEYDQVILD